MYPDAKIHSHRDFAAKACPSFDATTEYCNI
jgi:N-acetylmuramoyl-L-alanine amidase